MIYVFYLLLIYNMMINCIIINNDLTINMLKVRNLFICEKNFSCDSITTNGNNITFEGKCFLKDVFLNNIHQASNINFSYLILNENNICIKSAIIINDKTIRVNKISGINNNININTQNKSNNTLFASKTECYSSLKMNMPIYNINNEILLLSNVNAQNISSNGYIFNENIFQIYKPLYICSKEINAENLYNIEKLEINQRNGNYNLNNIVFSNIIENNINQNVLLITNNNTIATINNQNINYNNDNIDVLTSYNNLNINATNKIIIKTPTINKFLFQDCWEKKVFSIYMNAINDGEVYLNPYYSHYPIITSTVYSSSLLLNNSIYNFINLTANELGSNSKFLANGNNVYFDGENNVDLKWNPQIGSGLLLVLDENYQLFTIPSTSEKFMENIQPLFISTEDFLSAIKLNIEIIDNNISLNFKNLKNTILETIIRYDDNQEPLMYEERDLLAVYFTQLPNINQKIELLKENILLFQKVLDNEKY